MPADAHSRIGPRVVAIIPAGGGSQGIPRRNLARVAGQPLVTRAIATALLCPAIERVVVTTDDPEIAALAEAAGAGVVRRPPGLASDASSSEPALLHALDVLRERDGGDADLVALLQCTAPLMTAADISGTLEALRREDADCALAVCPSRALLWSRDASGQARGVNHDAASRGHGQDRAPEYVEAGSVYVMKTAGFRTARRRFFGRIALHVVPGGRHLEIHEPEDLALAEALAERTARARPDLVPDPLGGVVFDFDGVFTDNGVWTSQDGRETVRCDRSDGLGIGMLLRAGVPALVLSKEANPVVAARCAKLRIECRQGIDDKLPVLRAWTSEHGYGLSAIVYVGNDVNDVACLEAAGLGVAVADAWPAALRAARLRLERRGGAGAVREVCDLVLQALEARR